MELIQAGLSGSRDADKLKYFVREYCRTADIPAVFVELKAKHGALCDEIEAFEV
jgi:ribosomal protein L7Ae-like RNA K-turn-binding protein